MTEGATIVGSYYPRSKLWQDFRRAIKVMPMHPKARGEIEESNAVSLLPKEEQQGTMRGFGHR
jgi:uncharacterized protein (DUF2461 family)